MCGIPCRVHIIECVFVDIFAISCKCVISIYVCVLVYAFFVGLCEYNLLNRERIKGRYVKYSLNSPINTEKGRENYRGED